MLGRVAPASALTALDPLLSVASPQLLEVQHRLLDLACVLPVLGRALPERATVPIRVTGCRARAARTASARAAIAAGRLLLVYEVDLEIDSSPARTIAMLGVAPVSA